MMRGRSIVPVLLAALLGLLTSCGSSPNLKSSQSARGIKSPEYISAGTERVVAWQWRLFPDGTVRGTIHAIAKIGATSPVDLGTEKFVGRRQKIKITVESVCGGAIATVLERAIRQLGATQFESGSQSKSVIESVGPAAREGSCHAIPAGLIEGFLSQGDVAMTVIVPVTVGCPNTFGADSLIFVEGSASEFTGDVRKMTGTSGCPDAQPA